MDTTSLLIGVVAGFVVGALVFTQTGKQISGAAGRRVTRYIEPKYRRRR